MIVGALDPLALEVLESGDRIEGAYDLAVCAVTARVEATVRT
jgi:hypothetical protein